MDYKRAVNFLFEAGSLKNLLRTHHQVMPWTNDSIADHSFRVTIIDYTLARMEKCDDNKVIKMCLFHDLEEARTGDQNYVHANYVKADNARATKDQLQGLEFESEIAEYLEEYEKRETIEAKVVKDADIIEQMLLQQEYLYGDKNNRERWHKDKLEKLQTESGKKLAEEIVKANPMEWVYGFKKE